MIITLENFIKIIKKKFIKIIFVSIFISLLFSYLFFNISNTTVSKVYITVSKNFDGYENLINASKPLENLNISHLANRELLNEYFLKINNFRKYQDQEFPKMMESIFLQLNSSAIIKKNSKSKKYLTNNKIVYDQLLFSKEVQNEINKIINNNLENYINTLDLELNSLRLFDTLKNLRQNHQDYLINFEIFENNMNEFFNYKSFCLVRCYNIKSNPTQKQIYSSYEYENEYKEKIIIEYSNIEKNLASFNKILNNLESYNYENHHTIQQSKAAPIILFHEFFLFLFLISISLVSIFVLFKKSFDDEN